MKMFKLFACIGLACLFVYACSENSSTPTSQVEKQEAPASQSASADTVNTTGDVQQQATDTLSKAADTADQAATQVGETLSQTASQAGDAPTEMTGTLMQTEDGMTFVTDAGDYLLSGSDLSDLAGQRVKITGTLAEAGANKVLQVMSVLPAE